MSAFANLNSVNTNILAMDSRTALNRVNRDLECLTPRTNTSSYSASKRMNNRAEDNSSASRMTPYEAVRSNQQTGRFQRRVRPGRETREREHGNIADAYLVPYL